MADIYNAAKRSALMSLVRSGGNRSTELRLIGIFSAASITGWRRNYPLLGRPDFVFPHERVAVFVDGCFWHSCPLHQSRPATNAKFWKEKLNANVVRDRVVNDSLKKKGWRVLRVWQHELSKNKQAELVSWVAKELATRRKHYSMNKAAER